jgi:hypothetical protein
MKTYLKYLAALSLTFALVACGGQAHAASPAYVGDTILVTESSQGIIAWAGVITDLSGAMASINDTTPTVIGYATVFAPDYVGTAKVFNVYLFLTQAGALAYLTANPRFSGTVGWYRPATHN